MNDDIMVQIRRPCAACWGLGKVPASDRTWDNLPKFYDFSYCQCCQGDGYSQVWVTIANLRDLMRE